MPKSIIMISKVNLECKIKEIPNKPWSPVEVARVKGYILRMALFHGEYHWHKHENEDEIFCVYKGSIIIQVKNQPNIRLNEGEIAVIPEGTFHCPKSSEPSYVLLFQSSSLDIRGD